MSARPTAHSDARTPVILLTGFLGSGKTTLLKHLLEQPPFFGTGMVVNEFGDTDFNDVVLGGRQADLVAANAGCFCCQSRTGLLPALLELETRSGGRRYERIVVETSGLAAAGPVLQMLIGDPDLPARYRLGGVLTVVDPLTARMSLAESPEARDQVTFADLIIVSKTDVADRGDVEAVRRETAALNPRAGILEVANGDCDAAGLLALLELAASHASSGPMNRTAEGAPSGPDAVQAFTVRRNRPATRAGLALWMDLMSAYLGTNVLRVKGILNVEGELTVIEGVRHIFHPPLRMEGPEEAGGTVVVIARGLDRERIEQAFEALDYAAVPRPLDPEAYGRFKDIVSRLKPA